MTDWDPETTPQWATTLVEPWFSSLFHVRMDFVIWEGTWSIIKKYSTCVAAQWVHGCGPHSHWAVWQEHMLDVRIKCTFKSCENIKVASVVGASWRPYGTHLDHISKRGKKTILYTLRPRSCSWQTNSDINMSKLLMRWNNLVTISMLSQ